MAGTSPAMTMRKGCCPALQGASRCCRVRFDRSGSALPPPETVLASERGKKASRSSTFPRRSARRRICRVEHQGVAVHAIAQAGRLRSIIKDVAEMAAATAAVHLGSRDAKGPVLGGADRVLERPVKARPAGAALEFGLGRKQRQIATRAGEGSFAMLFQ